MAQNRIYAYCRVSKKDGSMEIENQIHTIEQWAKAKNIVISAFYKDECSGDTAIENRSQLPVMLENLRDGDTVIVTEIFRLYRSFTGLEKIYRYIVETKKAEKVEEVKAEPIEEEKVEATEEEKVEETEVVEEPAQEVVAEETTETTEEVAETADDSEAKSGDVE